MTYARTSSFLSKFCASTRATNQRIAVLSAERAETHEELANAGRALGTKSARLDCVGQAGDLVVALLDDDEVENRQLRADNAATNGFALALSSLARAVARVACCANNSISVAVAT